ncbi:MAG: M24 family metallopeptidase [bacterium]|nr:M24 family metallopeptidase [bacterium]
MYADHRGRLFDRLRSERAAAVVFTNATKVRNHDCDFRFRPDSDFWYLTGFAEPDAVLVMLPRLEEDGEDLTVLFLRERSKDLETWNGRRLGTERAPAALGVDEAKDVEELWTRLPELLAGYERIVYRTGVEPDRDTRVLETVNALRRKARGGLRPPVELLDVVPFVHELRLFKTEPELALMRQAAGITTEAHVAAMREAAPGKSECEIDALLEYTFKKSGSTGPAYNSIVAGGDNACILHYIENDQELGDGDLLLIDAGAEWQYYASDVTRTFPINGSFNPEQRAIYSVVLAAQLAAIEQARPGATFVSVHEAALNVLVDGLIDHGLCKGTREEVIESGDYRDFFMHKTSHWLGLDVHDCGYYVAGGESRTLEPGMVLTVEPGLYVAADEESVEPHWRGIGVRLEDDVLITSAGNEVLTAGVPKTIEDVEAACTGQVLSRV